MIKGILVHVHIVHACVPLAVVDIDVPTCRPRPLKIRVLGNCLEVQMVQLKRFHLLQKKVSQHNFHNETSIIMPIYMYFHWVSQQL